MGFLLTYWDSKGWKEHTVKYNSPWHGKTPDILIQTTGSPRALTIITMRLRLPALLVIVFLALVSAYKKNSAASEASADWVDWLVGPVSDPGGCQELISIIYINNIRWTLTKYLWCQEYLLLHNPTCNTI